MTSQCSTRKRRQAIFTGLFLYVISGSKTPEEKRRIELESYVKHHGGSIVHADTAAERVICISDRMLVSAAGLKKRGNISMFRPSWLFDCVRQAQRDLSLARTPVLLPYESRHVVLRGRPRQRDVRCRIRHRQHRSCAR